MALKEQDIVFTTTDSDGDTIIQMPITRAKNVEDLIELVYPIGSIYMSAVATSPAALFGGIWEALDDGRVLIGANDTYKAGTTGGEATHKLTTAEMPSHTHDASTDSTGEHTHTRGTMEITGSFNGNCLTQGTPKSSGAFTTKTTSGATDARHYSYNDKQGFDFTASNSWTGSTSSEGAHTHTVTVNSTGSGQAHNNMQPYLAVYMWKRIS